MEGMWNRKKIIQFFEHKVIIHYTANPSNVGRMPNRLVSQVRDNPTMNENRPSSIVGPRVRTRDLSGFGSLPTSLLLSLRYTAALAPGNRTRFEFMMSQPSFPCYRTILECNQGVVNQPFSPGNRTILIAIKDCSVTGRESWTSRSLLVAEQSLNAVVKQSFSPGDRTILECNREPALLSW